MRKKNGTESGLFHIKIRNYNEDPLRSILMDVKEYKKITNLAASTIMKFITDADDIRDLSHTVAIKYFLNEKSIDKKNENNWIYTCAKNVAIDLKRKKITEEQVASTSFEDYENVITKTILDKKKDVSLKEILTEYGKSLNFQEKQLIEQYVNNGYKVKKLWQGKRITYDALRKRVYRLRKEILAEYNKQKGMIASESIVGARLHENILYFIKQFKKAMLENSIDKISFYIRDCEKPVVLPDFNINEIIEYDICLIDDQKYRIFVYHLNKKNTFDCFITEFEVYNLNSIKIVDFPHKPSRIIQFNDEDASPEFYKKFKSGEKGIIEVSEDELAEFLETEVNNKKIIFDKNEEEQ